MDRCRAKLWTAALTACLAATAAGAARAEWTTVNAGRGAVAVQVPAGVDPSNPAPLAILLHGYGSTGEVYEDYLGMASRFEAAGFLYALPKGTFDATPDPGPQRYWAATDGCCNKFQTTTDDVGYLEDLIAAIDAAHGVREVHVFGVSNGGFMSYRFACERSSLVKSIVSISGATWKDASLCAPATALRVLEVHGTLDSQILYGGGTWAPGEPYGLAPYPSTPETMGDWAGYNGCDATSTAGAPFDADSSLAGNETKVERWLNCDAGGATELWRIVGGEHLPFFTAAFKNRLIRWFRNVSLEIFYDGFEGGGLGSWSDNIHQP